MKKVFFGGVFDLMHYGHIKALKEAKKLGDYLIVNVLSDERTKAKKGKGRPILPAKERVKIVKELKMVDEVVCLYGDPEYPTIKMLDMVKPDILVLDDNEHADYTKEKEACEKRGIKLVLMKRIITESELDTTNIINKIKNNEKNN